MTPRDAEGLSVELLPCPFCGDAPLVKVRPADKFETGNTGKVWSITCYGSVTNAHAWFYADTKEKVVAAWNRRTQAPAAVGEGVGEAAALLQDARGPLVYAYRNVGSVTADKVLNRIVPAIDALLGSLQSPPAEPTSRPVCDSELSPPASSDLEGGEPDDWDGVHQCAYCGAELPDPERAYKGACRSCA